MERNDMKAIINATLVMPDYYIFDGAVTFEDGKIVAFGEAKDVEIPAGCEIIDANGLYVGPGLIDEHTHAAAEYKYCDFPEQAANVALAHGVTTALPTVDYRVKKEDIRGIVSRIEAAMKVCPNIGGINMEGPFINPNYGSHKYLLSERGKITEEDYREFIDAVKHLVRIWTVAPELPGIREFVKAAAEATPGVAFAVGHSEAAPWDIEALIPYGLRAATHHTDATGKFHAWPDKEILGVGVDEAVNFNSAIYAELICDHFGIHVAPYMLRLIRKIKSDERIILISDSTYHPASVTPKEYSMVTDLNFDAEEEIAGSKVFFDEACQNWIKHTGASIAETFRVASLNPAENLHFYDRGKIEVGNKADFTIVDDKFNVKKVVINGELAVEK